jgi:hypothetical protein
MEAVLKSTTPNAIAKGFMAKVLTNESLKKAYQVF